MSSNNIPDDLWQDENCDWEELLDELLDLDNDELTEWEVEFTDNLDQNFRGRALSEKQYSTLTTLYERNCT